MIIMSTVLISFDLADSSSKSVVGRGIALILLAGFLAFVYATVRRSSEKLPAQDRTLSSDGKIAYVESEADLLYARPKPNSPSGDLVSALPVEQVAHFVRRPELPRAAEPLAGLPRAGQVPPHPGRLHLDAQLLGRRPHADHPGAVGADRLPPPTCASLESTDSDSSFFGAEHRGGLRTVSCC